MRGGGGDVGMGGMGGWGKVLWPGDRYFLVFLWSELC